MTQAIDSLILTPSLPTSPRPIAQSVGSGFVPVIYHPGHRFERLMRKAKTTPEAALRHAERVIWFRQLRITEAKRHLAAVSDPWWLEVIASMNLKPMTVHTPVNRERTGFQGWGV